MLDQSLWKPFSDLCLELFKSRWNLLNWLCCASLSGCDVNSPRKPGPNGEGEEEAHDGQTPLHLAACWGLEEVIQCLLEFGANVNAQVRIKMVQFLWSWFFNFNTVKTNLPYLCILLHRQRTAYCYDWASARTACSSAFFLSLVTRSGTHLSTCMVPSGSHSEGKQWYKKLLIMPGFFVCCGFFFRVCVVFFLWCYDPSWTLLFLVWMKGRSRAVCCSNWSLDQL